MRASRFSFASAFVVSVVTAGVGVSAPAPAEAQAPSQTATAAELRQEIDQLRREFEGLKQQYGDRLTALEAKLAGIGGGAAAPTAAPQPTAPVGAGAQGAGGPAGQLPVYGAA